METLRTVFAAVFGLVWGSFLNVVIHRVPRGQSLAHPPSTCPRCGSRIKPYDNVPVLSWLALRGRCRACGLPISPLYPAVELLTGAVFVLLYVQGGRRVGLALIAALAWSSLLIALAFIDAYHQILPDALTYPGIALAFAFALVRPDMTLRDALAGAVLGSGFLMAIYLAYLFVRRKEGLGMGDVTLMVMIGAFLGWRKTLLTLILASLAGSIVGLGAIAFRGKRWQTALPFGTFLAPAAFAAFVWGDRIIEAYLKLYR